MPFDIYLMVIKCTYNFNFKSKVCNIVITLLSFPNIGLNKNLYIPNCVLRGLDSIHDKLISNKANVSILANNPALSCLGVISNSVLEADSL